MLGGDDGGANWLSYRGLFVLSVFLQAIGLLLIGVASLTVIRLGLAIFITGSGLNVSCLNMMLTRCYQDSEAPAKRGFGLSYTENSPKNARYDIVVIY